MNEEWIKKHGTLLKNGHYVANFSTSYPDRKKSHCGTVTLLPDGTIKKNVLKQRTHTRIHETDRAPKEEECP